MTQWVVHFLCCVCRPVTAPVDGKDSAASSSSRAVAPRASSQRPRKPKPAGKHSSRFWTYEVVDPGSAEAKQQLPQQQQQGQQEAAVALMVEGKRARKPLHEALAKLEVEGAGADMEDQRQEQEEEEEDAEEFR